MGDPNGNDEVHLAPASTDAGAMERLFLLEATSPGYINKYRAEENLSSMRLMRQTIENRLKSPREYGARGATTPTDIVELGNQFAGFSAYPILDARMGANLQDILRFANDSHHPLQKAYRQFIADSVTAATEDVVSLKAIFPNVTAWRTHGSSSPGPRFRELTTLSGNTFYSTLPVPPHPPHDVRHRSRP
ncbi:hypothetical protein KZX46_07885 [Polymorphobacter sp. PAMC 29334]|uniref:hypothetical protein n=1 Tax=Polymorphobacter sp. PAMC 29334 TaxID=2862331 RepID=UPI001C7740DB|nr:hypothetical protein [Polymorphobacter sp. PAMC 29334]QYE35858.1 hypothetical protein KZX46_07885 [Polymorphobacter sp. PAMC 29334]